MDNGEKQFARKCSVCHSLTASSKRRAGPTLYGVFGRKVGSVEDYPYSKELIDMDLVWDERTIDLLFKDGPDIVTPGSKMPVQRIQRRAGSCRPYQLPETCYCSTMKAVFIFMVRYSLQTLSRQIMGLRHGDRAHLSVVSVIPTWPGYERPGLVLHAEPRQREAGLFIVSQKTQRSNKILTAAHVVNKAKKVRIQTHDEQRFNAKVRMG